MEFSLVYTELFRRMGECYGLVKRLLAELHRWAWDRALRGPRPLTGNFEDIEEFSQ
jgi:hypothetical protein